MFASENDGHKPYNGVPRVSLFNEGNLGLDEQNGARGESCEESRLDHDEKRQEGCLQCSVLTRAERKGSGKKQRNKRGPRPEGPRFCLGDLKIECTGELDIHPGVMNGR